ncbi:HD domain-containing protein [Methanopyrus kandleri]
MKVNSKFPWEREVIEFVRTEMSEVSPSHDFEHVKRVVGLCEFIRRKEGGDPEILRAAAWLHDIGRPAEERSGEDHAEVSAEIAEDLLPRVGFPSDKLGEVTHAIRAHRFSTGPEPRTLEAKILQDADNLDALGAVGIARCFCVVGERGTSLESGVEHFHEKLLRLPELMHTETARRLAEERRRRMVLFLEWLEKERRMRS